MKNHFLLLAMAGAALAMPCTGGAHNPGPDYSAAEIDAQRRRERARYGVISDFDRARLDAARAKQERKAVKREADQHTLPQGRR